MTEPTDAEIIALADETRTAEGGASGYILPISFARAVLAKWGNPATTGVEPVFAFRRKGLDDFCTCTEERYAELSAKPNLFETRIFYTTPPTQAADSVLEDAARLDWLDEDAGNHVTRVGKTWYTRPAYGSPYRKHKNLRAAIDAARAAQEGR